MTTRPLTVATPLPCAPGPFVDSIDVAVRTSGYGNERECRLLVRRGTLFRGTEHLADQKDGSMGAILKPDPATPGRHSRAVQ